jgi:ATP-dependent DNA helicase RecG
MSRSELLGPDTRRWLSSLERQMPTGTHEIALAMMRTGFVTNAALREWGADQVAATRVLRDLVEWGLALKQGGRRYARYVLDPSLGRQPDLFTQMDDRHSPGTAVEEALRRAGEASAAELMAATGLSRVSVLRHLAHLGERGLVEAVGAPRSPRRRYRWRG